MTRRKILVLTVGTGNMLKLEATLFKPLAKSISQGEWNKIVLLPSRVTEGFALHLTKRFPDLEAHVHPLPEERMENDPDACFRHFDQVLGQLASEGYEEESITIDFTRGTKAMSAAAVLAAVRRGNPKLRYVWGDRDSQGMVVAGTERIEEIRTTQATGRRLLDQAADLMEHGDYAAVLELLPAPANPSLALQIPTNLLEEAAQIRQRAAFYAAWDHLNYKEAARLANEADLGDAAVWVQKLAQQPKQSDHSRMGRWLRAVACDLLENGRRRIRDGHFEDALLRGYRVLELVGQFKLFDYDIDSSSIDPNNEAVQRLRRRLQKKKSQDFGVKNGRLQAPRELTARLLIELGDSIGRRLIQIANEPSDRGLRARNQSILIHGFSATVLDSDSLKDLFNELEQLLCDVESSADKMLRMARKQY